MRSHPIWQRFKSRVIEPSAVLATAIVVISSVFFSGCAIVNTQCEFACEKTPAGYAAIRRNCAIDERHGFIVFASRCADNNGPRYR